MIVVRIYLDEGKAVPLVSTGGVRMHPYDGKNDGWFPVESFNFGFKEKTDESKPSGGAPGPAKRRTGRGRCGLASSGTAIFWGKKESKDFAEVSLEKQVDTASSSLMHLAMAERKTKKGKEEAKLQADIHVVASLSSKGMQESGHFTYTSLMIHLEAVNVQSWEIRSSGDSRPTESVKLRYDRAAMIYYATSDGKEFTPAKWETWDQTKNDKFPWDGSKMKDYVPPGAG